MSEELMNRGLQLKEWADRARESVAADVVVLVANKFDSSLSTTVSAKDEDPLLAVSDAIDMMVYSLCQIIGDSTEEKDDVEIVKELKNALEDGLKKLRRNPSKGLTGEQLSI